MLNIELIRFEAQDVITASVAHVHKETVTNVTAGANGVSITTVCECGATGVAQPENGMFGDGNGKWIWTE